MVVLEGEKAQSIQRNRLFAILYDDEVSSVDTSVLIADIGLGTAVASASVGGESAICAVLRFGQGSVWRPTRRERPLLTTRFTGAGIA